MSGGLLVDFGTLEDSGASVEAIATRVEGSAAVLHTGEGGSGYARGSYAALAERIVSGLAWLGQRVGDGFTRVLRAHGEGARHIADEVRTTDEKLARDAASGGPPERLGQQQVPLGRTYDRYESYLTDVAQRYGIRLRGTRPIWDSDLRVGTLGLTDPDELGWVIRISPGFDGEADLANTLAHELSHARDLQKGLEPEEPGAYASGGALEEWIHGRR